MPDQRKFTIETQGYTLRIYESLFNKSNTVFKIVDKDGSFRTIVFNEDEVLEVYQALENFITENSKQSPAPPTIVEPDDEGRISVDGMQFEFGD